MNFDDSLEEAAYRARVRARIAANAPDMSVLRPGGTDGILRSIIAERVLGLRGDVRLDKDVAFKDVPIGR